MPHLSSPTQPSPAPPHTAQPSPAQTSPIQSRPCQPSPAQPRQGQLNSAQPGPSHPSEAQVFLLLRLKLQAEEKTRIPHQYLQQKSANDCINKNNQHEKTRNWLQVVCASQRVHCNNNLKTLRVDKTRPFGLKAGGALISLRPWLRHRETIERWSCHSMCPRADIFFGCSCRCKHPSEGRK